MLKNYRIIGVFNWIFSFILIIIGLLNIVLVHPVPGLIYLALSIIYLPPANSFIQTKWSLSIPNLIKIILAIVVFIFTLGVSDLGDMIDKL